MATEDSVARFIRRAPPEEAQEFTIERDDGSPPRPGREAPRKGTSSRSGAPGRDASAESAQSSLPYPPAVARKYFIVPGPEARSRAQHAYADERGEYLIFKDEGARLATRREEGVVVRDLVAIAEHRGWPGLKVTGSGAFRREVWLEASARSLAVRGYEPTDLDRLALEKRQAGRAQSKHRSGLDVGERRIAKEWGSARPEAEPGVRRGPSSGTGGFRHLRHSGGGAGAELDQAGDLNESPAGGTGSASVSNRFRSLAPTEAVKEPNLAAAHSQLVVLNHALARAFPNDAGTRDAVLNLARDRLALHLERGNTIRRAEYATPVRDKAAERRAPEHEVEHDCRRRRGTRERDR